MVFYKVKQMSGKKCRRPGDARFGWNGFCRSQGTAAMARAVNDHPGVSRFQVRANPALLPGSVSLESRDGLVDNTVASRFESVETLFAQLAAGGSDAA